MSPRACRSSPSAPCTRPSPPLRRSRRVTPPDWPPARPSDSRCPGSPCHPAEETGQRRYAAARLPRPVFTCRCPSTCARGHIPHGKKDSACRWKTGTGSKPCLQRTYPQQRNGPLPRFVRRARTPARPGRVGRRLYTATAAGRFHRFVPLWKNLFCSNTVKNCSRMHTINLTPV